MKEKFNTSDLYLAEVKYADKEKGIEVMEPISYAFVYHQDNSFYTNTCGASYLSAYIYLIIIAKST